MAVFLSNSLDSPIVLAMLLLYLLLGMASLGVMLKTTPASQLRLQVNAWWRIFPLVSVSLYLHPIGAIVLALFIGVLAARELALHCSPARSAFAAFCIGILALALLAGWFSLQLSMTALAVLMAAQLAHFIARRQHSQLLLLLFLFTCCGIGFITAFATLPLSAALQRDWLFYLFAMTALNDIAQFITGKSFGKQKIAARISPNKTWQGLAGGMSVSAMLSLALGSYLQLAGAMQLAWLALLLSLGGFAGDLLFSAAKRFLGIKDFSQLIPGHGGILDRVDSLVVTAPLLYFAIVFLH